jgi:hypothetical protein
MDPSAPLPAHIRPNGYGQFPAPPAAQVSLEERSLTLDPLHSLATNDLPAFLLCVRILGGRYGEEQGLVRGGLQHFRRSAKTAVTTGGGEMREQAPALTRQDLEAKIVKRCWQDEGFRKEFTADPAGTAVKYLNVPTTSLPKMVVHEESAGSWHIVLPPRPANTDEVSERDIEKVAGASASWIAISVTSVSFGGGVSVGVSAGAMVTTDKGW